jgi:hypothetical protein
MKYWIIMLAIVTSQCFAGVNDEQIRQVEAEIARLSSIENPTRDTKMALWRLNNKLQQLKDLNV